MDTRTLLASVEFQGVLDMKSQQFIAEVNIWGPFPLDIL